MVSLAWGEGPSDPLIGEQVIDRSLAFRGAGFDSSVLLGLPAPESESAGLETVTLVRGKGFGALVRIIRGRMANLPERPGQAPVLVCRGALTAAAALLARASSAQARWAIVHDARGWYEAEGADKGDDRLRSGAKHVIEQLAFRHSDHNVVISEGLLGVGLARGASPETCSVIPQWQARFTGAGPDQGAQGVGLPPSAEVLYVGNSWHGHQADELVRPLLRGIAERLPQVVIGWLDAAATVPESVAPNLWRRSVAPEQVAAYLQRASVGLLIRQPTSTNAVAVPTKAAQYLAAGCGIVTSEYPPSIANLCIATQRGRVVSGFDPRDWSEAVAIVLEAPRQAGLDWRSDVIGAWQRILGRVERRGYSA